MVKTRLNNEVKRIDTEISVLKAAKAELMNELKQQSLFPGKEKEIHLKKVSKIKDIDTSIEEAVSDKAIIKVLIKRELW